MLFVSCISTVMGMVAVERYPRRHLLLSCGFANMSALSLFVLSAKLQNIWDLCKYGCIVAVVLHGVTYSFALGPISWFITAELVPLQFRALCQSLALSCNQAIAFVLCFITLPLYDKVGSLILLPLFVIPGLMAMFYLLCYLPETRSRSIDEVIQELKGGDKHSMELKPRSTQS
ncbi:MFS domain-containing protein [Trichostrongylus colubriformis]|uniref:MFS domain-containing protein n=1 Tax=Trichostrongylus colubriformis TaxID=6319 RepID=A0AAN8GAS4_TRICO